MFFLNLKAKCLELFMEGILEKLEIIYSFQINYLLLILVCFWVISLIFGSESYQYFKKFSESMVGKFFIIGFIWSYLFQILSEIRHWFWDMGYGFELKTTKITGVIVILGSFILTIALYLLSGVLI